MYKQTDREFFEERVFRPETPCWNWRSYINRKGYGTWRRDNINTYVHRVAYELFVGPIPDGYEVHHTCCNRSCVNPEHLQAVTHAENIRLIERPERTHCPQGHVLEGENLVILRTGQRVCRTCRNAATRAANERKRREAGQKDMSVECKNGHPRTPENTYTYKGRRRCRLCEQARYLKPGGYFDPDRQRPTHCPHGHEYTGDNTYVTPKGARICRTCNRESARRSYRKRTA